MSIVTYRHHRFTKLVFVNVISDKLIICTKWAECKWAGSTGKLTEWYLKWEKISCQICIYWIIYNRHCCNVAKSCTIGVYMHTVMVTTCFHYANCIELETVFIYFATVHCKRRCLTLSCTWGIKHQIDKFKCNLF